MKVVYTRGILKGKIRTVARIEGDMVFFKDEYGWDYLSVLKILSKEDELEIKMKEAEIAEIENRLKENKSELEEIKKEYKKSNEIKPEEIVPGAQFVYTGKVDSRQGEVVTVIKHYFDLYMLGGLGGNPYNLYDEDYRLKEDLLNYLNINDYKRVI